ncbi:MAG: ROK family protein [Oscillospiraceae bacterium]|nr:ROK family protein [Oscillospiraceae bacterium]
MTNTGGGEHSVLSARSRIYRVLYNSRGQCTKQSLAKSCSISMPTVYQNLRDLMSEGLVRYSGRDLPTGGRKALGLDIVPEARISIGVAVDEHKLRLIAVDLRLRELAYRELQFDLVSSLSERGVSLAETLETFLDANQLDRGRLLGVGVTIPGLISPDHTKILCAPTLGLRNAPLEALTRGIPYPLLVENDGSASGHAECFVRGAAKNMAYLSLEEGVGGAVLMSGKPYEGDQMQSGEFGHICVEPGGLRCSCGRQGCLEAYCSARRIEERFDVSLETFFRGVAEHEPEYEHLLYDMLRHLAVAVSNIYLVLNCDVVIGGFLSEYLQPWLPVLRRYVLTCSPFAENADFVRLSALRRHITPLGAALYHVRKFVDQI